MRRVSYWEVEGTASDRENTLAEQYGYACALMASQASHGKLTVAYLWQVLTPAIQQENIKFYFNQDGAVVGYVIWASLCPAVEQRVIGSGQFQLHLSEWNEGDSLWIVDLLVPHGSLKYVLADLRDQVFAGRPAVRYVRRKNQRRMIKEMARNPRQGFFSSHTGGR